MARFIELSKKSVSGALIWALVGVLIWGMISDRSALDREGRIVIATVVRVKKSGGRHQFGYNAQFRYVYEGKRYVATHRRDRSTGR